MQVDQQNDLSSAKPETEQACVVRDANELTERANTASALGGVREALRCECGDVRCGTSIRPTAFEYEDVRGYGSRFMITLDHENPECVSVLSENERFAVIDVVDRDARHTVLARNLRHTWTDTSPTAAHSV